MEYQWIAIVVFALINGVFTVLFVKRAESELANTLEGLKTELVEGVDALNSQLEPIILANSKAMGAISHLSDGTKMDKALERRIGLDMMDQTVGEYGDVLELIKMGFPRVAEYLEEKPEALTKLLPRLNTLISDPDARKRLKLDVKGKTSDVSRIWSEERD